MQREPRRIRTVHIDDPDIAGARFLEREHERFRMEPTTAEAGLEYAEANSVDCILADHDIPGRDAGDFLGETGGARFESPGTEGALTYFVPDSSPRTVSILGCLWPLSPVTGSPAEGSTTPAMGG